MEITINDKKIDLKFGVRFVRELDKIAAVEVNGQSFGFSLQKTLPALSAYDPVALSNVIYSASYGAAKRPSQNEIDDWIDSIDTLPTLYKGIIKEIESSNATKLAAKNLKA